MRKEKISRALWSIFAVSFSVWLLLVVIISVLDSQNNLPAVRLLELMLLWALAIGFLTFVLRKCQFLVKHEKCCLGLFLLIYGAALYGVCIGIKGIPVHDQYYLIQGARYLAGLSDEIYWEYFARCDNNIGPMVLLSFAFRMERVGIDAYHFAVLCNVLQVLAALYFVNRIIYLQYNDRAAAWSAMLLLAGCLPVIGHSQSLYTDALSFSWGIAAFWFWIVMERPQTTGMKKAAMGLLAGICWGIGIVMKPTVGISMLAVFLCLLLCRSRRALPGYALVCLTALLIVFGMRVYEGTLPCRELEDSYGNPGLSYWVGIGLKGNGGYSDNQEYDFMLKSIYGIEEKTEWSRRYIRDNLYEFVNPTHIAAKMKFNFASGGLGASEFLYDAEERGFFYEVISEQGKYYWRYCLIHTSYFYCLLLLNIAACAGSFWKKKWDVVSFVPLVSVFGIMLYVMIFEANNRQLYNHLPWIILGAEQGIMSLYEGLREKKCGRRKKLC